MSDGLTKQERYELAARETNTWAVWRPATRSRDGRWKHVKALSEKEALRKVRGATLARPWLPTRRWLAMPPLRVKGRRRR